MLSMQSNTSVHEKDPFLCEESSNAMFNSMHIRIPMTESMHPQLCEARESRKTNWNPQVKSARNCRVQFNSYENF